MRMHFVLISREPIIYVHLRCNVFLVALEFCLRQHSRIDLWAESPE